MAQTGGGRKQPVSFPPVVQYSFVQSLLKGEDVVLVKPEIKWPSQNQQRSTSVPAGPSQNNSSARRLGSQLETTQRRGLDLGGRLWRADSAQEPDQSAVTFGLYCVFDGHNGVAAAQYAAEHLLPVLHPLLPAGPPPAEGAPTFTSWREELQQALTVALTLLHRSFAGVGIVGGCSATVLLQADWLLTVANLGNSRAIIDCGVQVTKLTTDHSRERSLGDFAKLADGGIFTLPSITQVMVPSTGARVIIGSAGLWQASERLSKAVKMIRTWTTNDCPNKVLDTIARAHKGLQSDTSIVVVDLLPPGKPNFADVVKGTSLFRRMLKSGRKEAEAGLPPQVAELARVDVAVAAGLIIAPDPAITPPVWFTSDLNEALIEASDQAVAIWGRARELRKGGKDPSIEDFDQLVSTPTGLSRRNGFDASQMKGSQTHKQELNNQASAFDLHGLSQYVELMGQKYALKSGTPKSTSSDGLWSPRLGANGLPLTPTADALRPQPSITSVRSASARSIQSIATVSTMTSSQHDAMAEEAADDVGPLSGRGSEADAPAGHRSTSSSYSTNSMAPSSSGGSQRDMSLDDFAPGTPHSAATPRASARTIIGAFEQQAAAAVANGALGRPAPTLSRIQRAASLRAAVSGAGADDAASGQLRGQSLQPSLGKATSITRFKQGLLAEVAMESTPEEVHKSPTGPRLGKALSARNFQQGLLMEVMSGEEPADASPPDETAATVMKSMLSTATGEHGAADAAIIAASLQSLSFSQSHTSEKEQEEEEEGEDPMPRTTSLPRLEPTDPDPFGDPFAPDSPFQAASKAATEASIGKLLDDLLFAEEQHQRRVAELAADKLVMSHSITASSDCSDEGFSKHLPTTPDQVDTLDLRRATCDYSDDESMLEFTFSGGDCLELVA